MGNKSVFGTLSGEL